MVKQITVFLENSEGRLSALCRCLGDAGVSMKALTIAETSEYGLIRIIADDPQNCVKVLTDGGFHASLTDVTAIEVPNRAGGLADLLDKLADLDLNIEYGYCFSTEADRAVDVAAGDPLPAGRREQGVGPRSRLPVDHRGHAGGPA